MAATATQTLSAFKASPLGYGPFRTMRLGVIGVYVVWAGLSVIWALTGGTAANPIGAVIGAGRAAEGATYVALRNGSSEPWTSVVVRLDQDWLLEVGEIAPGAAADLQVTRFVNVYALPRPTGLFFWEDGAARRPPALHPPRDFSPATVTVETDQGRVEKTLEL